MKNTIKKIYIKNSYFTLENNEILISKEFNKIIMWQDKIDERKITIH